MMRTVTVVRQYLVATFLILIGLAANGCGDSATVSEPAELGNLSVSVGTLQPSFNPATTSYIVQLSSDVSSTTITASPRVAGDTIRIDNQQTTSQTVTVNSPGEEKSVSIVVTDSGSGGGSKSYTVRVRRDLEDNSLQALSVSNGTLSPSPFDKDTLNYSVNGLDASDSSITVSATKSDPDSIMQIGSVTVPAGTPSGQATVQLGNTGSATSVSIDVTRPNGSKKTYTVTINRGPSDNSFLRGLSIPSPSGLRLSPAFRSSVTGYTVNVANNVTNIRVTPTAQDTSARITVNGLANDSGQASQLIPLNEPGVNDSRTNINITVIAQNNSQRAYTVTVIRAALGGNNNLSNLTVSPGSLAFDAARTNYTVNVGSSVEEVRVTPTLRDPAATLAVTSNGQVRTSGQARIITLRDAGLSTTVNIVVRAQNGSEKAYTVTVDRAETPPPSGNNNLSALTVRLSTSSPNLISFSPNTMSYTVDVESGVSTIRVTPTLQDASASLTVTSNGPGPITTSGQARSIPLRAAGLSTTINIVVRALNGSEKPYTVTIDRADPPPPSGNNNLSALSVNGSSVPGFTQGTLDYTVNVASGVNEVTVTATKADPNAVISGSLPNEGQATIPLDGAPSSKNVSIIVTAPNLTSKTYTVIVNRAAPAAPPAPTVAPDLISQDDSCPRDPVTNVCFPPIPPVTTPRDQDNRTNVTTPRFRIVPAAGQTPNLLINGSKVESLPNTGDNTLRPIEALSDGPYTITYTMTNAGGDSPPSPALAVIIDTAVEPVGGSQ